MNKYLLAYLLKGINLVKELFCKPSCWGIDRQGLFNSLSMSVQQTS